LHSNITVKYKQKEWTLLATNYRLLLVNAANEKRLLFYTSVQKVQRSKQDMERAVLKFVLRPGAHTGPDEIGGDKAIVEFTHSDVTTRQQECTKVYEAVLEGIAKRTQATSQPAAAEPKPTVVQIDHEYHQFLSERLLTHYKQALLNPERRDAAAAKGISSAASAAQLPDMDHADEDAADGTGRSKKEGGDGGRTAAPDNGTETAELRMAYSLLVLGNDVAKTAGQRDRGGKKDDKVERVPLMTDDVFWRVHYETLLHYVLDHPGLVRTFLRQEPTHRRAYLLQKGQSVEHAADKDLPHLHVDKDLLVETLFRVMESKYQSEEHGDGGGARDYEFADVFATMGDMRAATTAADHHGAAEGGTRRGLVRRMQILGPPPAKPTSPKRATTSGESGKDRAPRPKEYQHVSEAALREMFTEYPQLKARYDRLVPHHLSHVEFWQKLFRSRLYHRLVGKEGPSLSVESDEENVVVRGLEKQLLHAQGPTTPEVQESVLPSVDLIASEAVRRKGFGTRDSFTSLAGDLSYYTRPSQYQLLVNRFNNQSRKNLFNEAAIAAATKPSPPELTAPASSRPPVVVKQEPESPQADERRAGKRPRDDDRHDHLIREVLLDDLPLDRSPSKRIRPNQRAMDGSATAERLPLDRQSVFTKLRATSAAAGSVGEPPVAGRTHGTDRATGELMTNFQNWKPSFLLKIHPDVTEGKTAIAVFTQAVSTGKKITAKSAGVDSRVSDALQRELVKARELLQHFWTEHLPIPTATKPIDNSMATDGHVPLPDEQRETVQRLADGLTKVKMEIQTLLGDEKRAARARQQRDAGGSDKGKKGSSKRPGRAEDAMRAYEDAQAMAEGLMHMINEARAVAKAVYDV